MRPRPLGGEGRVRGHGEFQGPDSGGDRGRLRPRTRHRARPRRQGRAGGGGGSRRGDGQGDGGAHHQGLGAGPRRPRRHEPRRGRGSHGEHGGEGARAARDPREQRGDPRRLLQRGRDERSGVAPGHRHRPHRRVPRLQACDRGDAAPGPRPHRQHGLGGRAQRHRGRGRVHRRQARGGRSDAPDGGHLLRARHHRQLRVPRAHPDRAAPALAGHPRPRCARHERARRGCQRRSDPWASPGGPPRHRRGHRLRGLLPGLRRGRLHHGPPMVVDGGWRAK
jgi:hypothetical protein